MNDIFISYASQDRAWAEKLTAELKKLNLKVFLDKNRLLAGNSWEEELGTALNESKNMVFLWSEDARASDWVQREAGYFSFLPKPERKLIPLVLSDSPRAYNSTQAITIIKDS